MNMRSNETGNQLRQYKIWQRFQDNAAVANWTKQVLTSTKGAEVTYEYAPEASQNAQIASQEASIPNVNQTVAGKQFVDLAQRREFMDEQQQLVFDAQQGVEQALQQPGPMQGGGNE
jgi:hypothetical protein